MDESEEGRVGILLAWSLSSMLAAAAALEDKKDHQSQLEIKSGFQQATEKISERNLSICELSQ